MKLTFNVTKENKKAFAKDIAAITGEKAVYQFTPTYSFAIGDLTVNRDATLTAPDGKDLSSLLEALKEKGYELAGSDKAEIEADTERTNEPESFSEEAPEQTLKDTAPESETAEASAEHGTPDTDATESTDDEITEFTISLPLASANTGTLMNLISSKESLIKKALAITDTRINITEDKIEFPWFDRELTPEEVNAYTRFLSFLCKLSKEVNRCSGKEHPAANEKYTFRCFLLRLGFIGAEYKEDRKVLLKNLTGSSAFKNGAPAKEVKA
jgi:hypothetical protein